MKLPCCLSVWSVGPESWLRCNGLPVYLSETLIFTGRNAAMFFLPGALDPDPRAYGPKVPKSELGFCYN